LISRNLLLFQQSQLTSAVKDAVSAAFHRNIPENYYKLWVRKFLKKPPLPEARNYHKQPPGVERKTTKNVKKNQFSARGKTRMLPSEYKAETIIINLRVRNRISKLASGNWKCYKSCGIPIQP
jgi:hypothetical protein